MAFSSRWSSQLCFGRFALVAAAVTLSACGANETTIPAADSLPLVEEVVEATTTTAPTTTAAPTTTTTTTTTTTVPLPTLERSAIAGLFDLENLQVETEQRAGSLEASNVTVMAGELVHSVGRINASHAERISSPNTVWELDGEVWYLKPAPASTFVDPRDTELENFESLFDLPAEITNQTDEFVEFRLICTPADKPEMTPFVAQFCGEETELTIEVDQETGLATSFVAAGSFETWPGKFQDGFLEYTFTVLEEVPVITPPANVDTTRFECMAELLRVSEYSEVNDLLDQTTTAQNQQLFTPCGWSTFPRGNDFTSD